MGDVEVFEAERSRLTGIAYRMLGSASDAEDIVQEAYLRWVDRRERDLDSAPSYLTTIVVRLCIDELRSARARRETYVGPWLPEPVLVDDNDPGRVAELADTLSLAFLVLLEELAPVERAAFLLHDVFDYGYGEIAGMLGRQEPACRQLVSRARHRVGERRQRFDADEKAGRELAARFLIAVNEGDLGGLLEMLADDAMVYTDGGGQVKAARRPIVGKDKCARFLIGIAHGFEEAEIREANVNGHPGYLFVRDGTVLAATAVDIIDGKVVGLWAINNPEKLAHLEAQISG
jgi:RNA polymerase sigma-70 factor (ECF subfamily)